ncbi:SusC/RagA family TonB-linked outer membrane protein [Sphingobacterium faecale]|uniref:SusC/RagA family TonB-linked outer membrane protein n=1 Tax=Sphingobacterium faecale TaxID=2803775 RepID=A0ABS1R2G0_9SPHI|nr:SusC/RagA family TonB-linked outer membrane protein [Sphingobacterium faecale]MBL1408889.1 SusC/RagA family TonB-linked outer membrane protein [Sphingobacterium faecale]
MYEILFKPLIGLLIPINGKGYRSSTSRVENPLYRTNILSFKHVFMRITLLSLFLGAVLVHASPNVNAQRITLNKKSISVIDFFREVRKQTAYDFVYDHSIVKDKRVSLVVNEMPLEQLLEKVLPEIQLSWKVKDRVIVINEIVSSSSGAIAQQPITGKVTNEKGVPLIGASVFSAQQNTLTDEAGKFSIAAKTGDVITIRYVGYETKTVSIVSNEPLRIQMHPQLEEMEDVVVTALGLKKSESSLGYAVENVKGDVFEKVKSDKVIDMLAGRVAGLRVNSRSGVLQDAAITLRGREPLYVVNGNPVNVGFRGIAADDIESVTVLKGPQASVLYGSRGIDGAIVITTKNSGKSDEVEIAVNSSNMLAAGFISFPEVQEVYGQGEFGQYAFKDGKGGGLYDDIWIWGPKLNQKDPNTPSGYWETPQYNSPKDPTTGELIPLPWVSNKNNLKRFLQRGATTNNNVTLSQRLKDGGYSIGVNQMYRQGMVPNTSVNQIGLNVGGNYTIRKRLKVDVNVNYSNLFTDNYPPVGYANDQVFYNTVMYMGANTDIMDLRNYWKEGREGYEQRNYNYAWFQNPWFIAYEYIRPYAKKRVISSINFDYDFGKNTHFILKAGNDYQFTNNETFQPYAWVNGETGKYSKATYDETLLDINAMVTTKQQFGKWSLDAMAGVNWNELDRNTMTGETNGGLIVPDVYNFTNSKKQATVSNYRTDKRMYGLYGSLTMDWDATLFLTFTGRNDWSSALIKNNRSYFYPSVSSSIIVSNLVKLPEPISFLKVRGSWVNVGRDMDAYNLSTNYYLSQVWGSEPAFAPEDRVIDPNIGPSMTDSYEMGFDIRFFNNKLRLDASYFNTLDKNWIQEVNIPHPSGHSKMLTNGNAYLRDGYEFILSGKLKENKDFSWEASANFSSFKTVLYDIYNNQYNYGNFKIGDRSDAFYATVYMREPGTENFVVGNNGLPLVDKFSRNMGNKDPKWEAGLTNNIRYKDWNLSFNVSGRFGGLIYSQLNARMLETGADKRTASLEREEDWDRVPSFVPTDAVVVSSGDIKYSPTGEILEDTRVFEKSTVPVMYKDWMRQMGSLGGRMTKGWNVYDASFIKLRDIAITYTLDKHLVHWKAFKSANVSLIGNNVLMWKKLPHEDPDGNVSTLGYPTERYLGLNLNVKF